MEPAKLLEERFEMNGCSALASARGPVAPAEHEMVFVVLRPVEMDVSNIDISIDAGAHW